MGEASKAVLITGCSSGIGRAIAERLVASGQRVYATARRPDAIADLAEQGCETLALDVLDDDSMHAAVARVEDPGDVAKTVERAITARSPRTRYRVTVPARLLPTIRRALSDRAFDAF